ncbi:hypothetical protein CA13_31340 [Planctomycetes bacterium CA13]|uniref:Uncharacterized protein n=1 Tax=Novipirellula herctigrandis TaxID=2527986 RepID=A0A5C5Z4B1_9BACT|nr:hypothetical protein CA13_31340 [Planctomycetes bacterium CA13]
MLETTRIAGDPPDAELVYALRRRALSGVDLLDLFRFITEHQQTPEGEIHRLSLFAYIRFAFGGTSEDFRDLKLLLNRIERVGSRYTTTDLDVAATLASNIASNRSAWCDKLGD